MHRLNLKLLRRALRHTKPYWVSEDKKRAWWLLIALIVLLLLDTQFSVWFNEQSGEFTSALAAQEGPRFWKSIGIFFGLLVVAVPIYAYYYWARDKLALNWRRWLTARFMDRYFKNRGYYHLLNKPEIDNPDQRISNDIESFTADTLSFLLIFAGGFLQIIAFSRVLWSISGLLVLFLFMYAAIATGITFGVFGEKMVTLHATQRRREADFRFGLVRVRENAESIALYHGEGQEQAQLTRLFTRVFANSNELIRWSLRLNFVYYSNSFLTMVLPTLIIAPRVLSGELEVGRIVQATGAFSAILGALTLLLDNLEDLSNFAASVGRLEDFAHSLTPAGIHELPKPKNGKAKNGKSRFGKFRRKKQPEPPPPPPVEVTRIVTEEGELLGMDNLTLKTPNFERTLVKALTVSVAQGEGLMIVGASGLGKSSLLRAFAGLWDSGEGTLKRPKPEEMLFLPQHAYMVIGSLRAQLNYPTLDGTASDTELRKVLEMVNLSNIVERCGGFDAQFEFDKILSAGERQRLAFARVLLRRPRYVLLDEATSALDRDNENALYCTLKSISTTLVSVSHHPALVKYHTHVLELKAEGAWDLHPAKEFQFTGDLV